MGGDPNDPGYTPDDKSSRDGLGDVGHGNQFGVDLYALYKAGRVHFPDQAYTFSTLTSDLQYTGHLISRVANSVGNPSALTKLESIRDTLHSALYRTATILNEVGPALIRVADDYAATDADARGSFTSLLKDADEKGNYQSPTRYVPPPVKPDEPYVPPGGPHGFGPMIPF